MKLLNLDYLKKEEKLEILSSYKKFIHSLEELESDNELNNVIKENIQFNGILDNLISINNSIKENGISKDFEILIIPSLESLNITLDNISEEGIGDMAKKAWDWIKKILGNVITFIKNILRKITGDDKKIKDLEKKIKEYDKKVEDLDKEVAKKGETISELIKKNEEIYNKYIESNAKEAFWIEMLHSNMQRLTDVKTLYIEKHNVLTAPMVPVIYKKDVREYSKIVRMLPLAITEVYNELKKVLENLNDAKYMNDLLEAIDNLNRNYLNYLGYNLKTDPINLEKHVESYKVSNNLKEAGYTNIDEINYTILIMSDEFHGKDAIKSLDNLAKSAKQLMDTKLKEDTDIITNMFTGLITYTQNIYTENILKHMKIKNTFVEYHLNYNEKLESLIVLLQQCFNKDKK